MYDSFGFRSDLVINVSPQWNILVLEYNLKRKRLWTVLIPP